MKRLLLSALCSLLAALPAFAILDTNNNGLSDLWEKQHHSGALFPSSIDPQDDTDQDGWTNAQEAEAGTNPFVPNPPDGMVRPLAVHILAEWSEPDEYGEQQLITPEANTVTWPTLAGKQYTLNFSPDLTQGSWLPVGSPFIATGGVSEYGFYNISGTEKLFWRVVVEDADSDNDGLTNHEEYLVGSNPNLTDSDGDNLPDAWEVQHSLDPNDAGDANADPDQDGLNNSEEAELQTDPNNSDSDGDHILDGQDAVPTDGEINWARTPENQYVWIPVTATPDGQALAVNSAGQILFVADNYGIDSQLDPFIQPFQKGTVYNAFSGDEIVLASEGAGVATNITINTSAYRFTDIGDTGVVSAISNIFTPRPDNNYGDWRQAGMTWTPSTDPADGYRKVYNGPNLFMNAEGWDNSVDALHKGVAEVGRIATDGSVSCITSKNTATSGVACAQSLSTYLSPVGGLQTNELESFAVETFDHYPGDILDQNRTLYYGAVSFPGAWEMKLHRNGNFETLTNAISVDGKAEVLSTSIQSLPFPEESTQSQRVWISNKYKSFDPVYNPNLTFVYVGTDSRVLIEKRPETAGSDPWHQPPSMSEGAICLGDDGTAITETKVWRNGTYTPINDLVSKPDGSDLNITKLIDLASNGIILAEATEGGTTKTGLLLPMEVVSTDKFLAGSLEIPEGWDSLELEFVGPSDENLGKYGQLLGGGSTKIYDQAEDILSESDIATGGQSDSQKVWFVKDSENERKINFYTCFNSLGEAEIKLYLNGTSTAIGSITQELKSEQTFADVIVYVDDWVKGYSFYLPDTTTPPLGLMAVPMAEGSQSVFEEEGISNLTRAALIPFFQVINQVEGLSSLAVGLFDGVRNGIEDDWEFIKLVGQAAVAAGDYAYQQAQTELQKWKDDPLKRASELKQLADKVCEDWVFGPMQQLREDLSTWEGFKRRAWQTIFRAHQRGQKAWTLTKSAWSGIVDGLTDWADDFCDRMMSDSEKAHWDSVPWAKDKLLTEINSQTRLMCYTFGYTFGYLSEQVAVGALSAGSVKVAQVATKGGVSLAGTLAKRTAANLAARAHLLKRILAEATEELSTAAVMAYQRGLSLASTGPTGPGFDRCAMEIMQHSANAGRMVWREYIDNIVGKVNIRQFVKQGSGHIIERQTARLMEILGDDFSTQIARNFLKVADEVILVPKADGSVDDFFEAFFKAFEGNPSLMNHADDVSVRVGGSLDPMSANAKATLKKFLSDPNASKLWEIDVPAIVDNEPVIPHNYWVRGILGELSIFKRSYKAAGYDHFPTAPAFDFKSAAEYVQIKTLKNPDGAYGAMKKAVDALAGLPPPPSGPAGLKLHILKKPGSGSDQLEEALLFYINNSNDARVKQVQVIIQEFELVP